MVTINQLVKLAQEASCKTVNVKHIDGPLGVRGRNSDNKLIAEKLGWAPNYPLKNGIKNTYEWIGKQLNEN